MVERAWGQRLLYCAAAAFAGLQIIPRIAVDYGADGDARRSAAAAQHLASTGSYEPSRLPGNPLFEYTLAALVPWGGPVASNSFVAASYVLAVLAFRRLARPLPGAGMLTVLFALTPVVIVNAATTMDYMPGLALLLWSYALVAEGHLAAGAVLLGLSAGCRVTNLLFGIPLAAYALGRGVSFGRALRHGAVAVAVGAAFYGPIFEQAGPRLFRVPGSEAPLGSYAVTTAGRFVALLGLPALGALACLTAIDRRRLAAIVRRPRLWRSPAFAAEAGAVAVYSGLFVLHSDERDYLLPVVPFLLLQIGRWLSPRRLPLVLAGVVSPALFVLDPRHGLERGLVAADYHKRAAMLELRATIGGAAHRDHTVLLTKLGPVLTHENPALERASPDELCIRLDPRGVQEPENVHRVRGRDVYLFYGLSSQNTRRLADAGYCVRALDDPPGACL